MKKYVQNIWVRLVACILCTVSFLGILISGTGMFFFARYGDKEEVYAAGNEQIMENYALYAIKHLDVDMLDAVIGNTNMYITIESSIYESDDSLEPTISQIYSNMPAEADATYWMEEIPLNTVCYYNTKSLLGALKSYYYPKDVDHTTSVVIIGYAFDVNTGIFYYETGIGYFKADYIYVCENGKSYDYYLSIKNGVQSYYNSYYGRTLDTDRYKEWDWVSLAEKRMGIAESYGGSQITLVTDSSVITENLRMENYTPEYFVINYVSNKENTYRISMALADSLEKDDLFQEWEGMLNKIYSFQNYVAGILLGSIVLFIISFLTLIVSAPEEKERLQFFHKIPVLIFTGGIVGLEWLLAVALTMIIEVLGYNGSWGVSFENLYGIVMVIAVVMVFLAFVYLANIITRIRTKSFFRNSEFYYVSRPIAFLYHLAKENVSIFWKGCIVLLVVSIVEGFVLVLLHWQIDVLMRVFILFKIIEIPIILYTLIQMKHLQEGSRCIASGDLTQIDTSRMFWEFKKHGDNINKVSEGIALAVEEQLKSERFKTELITNVSHDIKTPLTSIINYVDLIKKEEITDETMIEYVDVLDRQSARLKKLIEDLMEASKASTGNLDVALEECDMGVLLTQMVGEYEEKFMTAGLEAVMDKPEEPAIIMADGRHMWRVLDNLLNNVCKYSQESTRVYITLTQDDSHVMVTFRNISKMALNIPSEQLMQRFVRGDSSRHTEGSGLGLSIAQSLTELMRGSMKLDIDGDLFKVTLTFRRIM